MHGELLIMQTRKLEKSLRQEAGFQLNSVRVFWFICLPEVRGPDVSNWSSSTSRVAAKNTTAGGAAHRERA